MGVAPPTGAAGAGVRRRKSLCGYVPARCPGCPRYTHAGWHHQTWRCERARLGEPPPVDQLVVCHGDACSPNTLIDDDGRCCGHADFGDLGVADRLAHLAVAVLSLGWNYPGRVWDAEFFAAYGVAPDPMRVDYYPRLWQAEDDTSR
jgi:aminoglycoside phosphotransferase (APT) family kinase protein